VHGCEFIQNRSQAKESTHDFIATQSDISSLRQTILKNTSKNQKDAQIENSASEIIVFTACQPHIRFIFYQHPASTVRVTEQEPT
jgi:hypothetical protein